VGKNNLKGLYTKVVNSRCLIITGSLKRLVKVFTAYFQAVILKAYFNLICLKGYELIFQIQSIVNSVIISNINAI